MSHSSLHSNLFIATNALIVSALNAISARTEILIGVHCRCVRIRNEALVPVGFVDAAGADGDALFGFKGGVESNLPAGHTSCIWRGSLFGADFELGKDA
jgi:hypothetical protein